MPPPPGPSTNQLNVTIVDASIADDDRPLVRFYLTDGQGAPIAPADVRLRFVIAVLQGDGGEYRDYLTTVQTSPDTKVAARQAAAEDSILRLFRELISVRRRIDGAPVRVEAPAGMLAFDRGSHRVVINLGDDDLTTTVPDGAELVLATAPARVADGRLEIGPHSAAILRRA